MRGVLWLAVVVLGSGCPPEELPSTLGDCAEGTELTWEQTKVVLDAHCTRCHSSALGEGERNDAPLLMNFDTEEDVFAHAYASWPQIWIGRMPKDTGPMPYDDAMILWEWFSCAVKS
jgi:uncharacterized membrane protein